MHILSIGNSFSQDAHRWLHELAGAGGVSLETANLFIGGCSLERHAQNLFSGECAYDYEVNGGPAQCKTSLKAALTKRAWDVVTLQQASHYSGMPQTYIPWLQQLAGAVRQLAPGAKLYIHQTWAYEVDAAHDGFANYANSQAEMFRRLSDAYAMAARLVDAPLIPVGAALQFLRGRLPAFDYEKGGHSLCRDGFHLSHSYGRYAAAAVWYETLTGRDVRAVPFCPPPVCGHTAEAETVRCIADAVHTFLCDWQTEIPR